MIRMMMMMMMSPVSIGSRLGDIDLAPNRDAAARLTLNKQGEALRWFYFPFEEEQGHDVSRPRVKPPQCMISPKTYCCGQPGDEEDTKATKTAGASEVSIRWTFYSCGRGVPVDNRNPRGAFASLLARIVHDNTALSQERC